MQNRTHRHEHVDTHTHRENHAHTYVQIFLILLDVCRLWPPTWYRAVCHYTTPTGVSTRSVIRCKRPFSFKYNQVKICVGLNAFFMSSWGKVNLRRILWTHFMQCISCPQTITRLKNGGIIVSWFSFYQRRLNTSLKLTNNEPKLHTTSAVYERHNMTGKKPHLTEKRDSRTSSQQKWSLRTKEDLFRCSQLKKSRVDIILPTLSAILE